MKPLSKGDTVKVRLLKTGKLADGIYDERDDEKPNEHWVTVNGDLYLAISGKTPAGGNNFRLCRFVVNPCVLLPVGVSV